LDIRYSVNQRDFRRYTTDEIRDEFLIESIFEHNKITAVYSHIDRMVAIGAMPVDETMSLDEGFDCRGSFGTDYILERREAGVFNIGGAGRVLLDGVEYKMNSRDCLYISMGTKGVVFVSDVPEYPAKFYMVSAPAHKPCETRLLTFNDAIKRPIGCEKDANRRVINQFIHPDVLETCQLSMGMTELCEGSVWNTMPTHTHERRMEIYLYFDVDNDAMVFHLMGEPEQTRHIAVKNEQAVVSPSWSIHSGCGTRSYSFIWAMGGENKAFDDMDAVSYDRLK